MTEADEQLFNLLSSDPVARRDLLKHAKRIKPELSIPEIDAASEIETRINDSIEPYKKELAEVKEQLGKKLSTDMLEQRRDSVRGAPFYLSDAQITELEERMHKDGNLYGSYPEALRYYQYQDSPVHPSGSPGISPFGRKASGGEDWRKMVKDPKSRLWKDRKNLMRENWQEASKELDQTRRR